METRTDKYWVSEYNFDEALSGKTNYPERVKILDLTLREGDQTPGCVFTTEEKVEIAKDLDDLGVDSIQMFAMVSEDDREALRELSKPGVLKNAKLVSLARATHRDIDAAASTGIKNIIIEGPANAETAKLMHFDSLDAVIDTYVDCIHYAKSLGLEAGAGVWDMCRGSNLDFFERFCKETVEAGNTLLYYADTFGFSMPWTVQNIVRKMRGWVGDDVDITCHFHNDFGLATANSLAAIAAGCNCCEVAMNGLGERVGNTPLDEVALNLELNMGIKTNIKLDKLYPVSKRIESMSKIPTADNKPIVGERSWTLGSGIIVDMFNKARALDSGVSTVASAYDPALVGHPDFKIVYGKGSGASMVRTHIENMGLSCTKEQVHEITMRIKDEALIIKDIIPEWRVDQIVREVLNA